MQYIDREGVEQYFSFKIHPDSMQKKITLLEYFRNYMQENLVKVLYGAFIRRNWLR